MIPNRGNTVGLGSVRAVSDSGGSVVQTSGTDAFGVPDANLTQGSVNQPFGYTGEQQLGSGLVDLRARVYDPGLGRFLKRDSFPGFTGSPLALNRYTYVRNNPALWVDPSGHAAAQSQVLDPGACPGLLFGGTSETWASPACQTLLAGSGLLGAMMDSQGATGSRLPGVRTSALTGAAAKDRIVLGHHPEYLRVADDLGARRFDIPTRIWNNMSDSERWAANQRFLDRAIARRSEIHLATPPDQARPGSYYERELQYLLSRGYSINADGTQLVPPVNR